MLLNYANDTRTIWITHSYHVIWRVLMDIKSIAIIGLGSVGSLIAASAIRSGINVTFMDGRKSDAGPAEFTVEFMDGHTEKFTLQPFINDNHSVPDAIVLACKTYQTDKAIEPILDERFSSTPVIIVQNGGGNAARLRRHLPNPMIRALAYFGAKRTGRTVIHSGRGNVVYGCSDHEEIALDALNQSDNRIFDWTKSDNIDLDEFRKLAVNAAINPITAIEDIPNGDIVRHRKIIQEISGEIAAAAKAIGYPITAAEIIETVYRIAEATATNSSSMREDVKNGRPTEEKEILGYLVDTLSHYDLPSDALRKARERLHNLLDNGNKINS